MALAIACDATDQSPPSAEAGTAGQSGAGGTAGYFASAGPGGIYTIGPVNNSLFPGGGAAGQNGTGAGGAGGAGGSNNAPACVLTGPSGAPPAIAVCGDGLLSAGEQCDDGNVLGEDSCSAECVAMPHVVAPHTESNSPLPLSGRDLGHGAHPLAAGCNRVGVGFLDRAMNPAALKLATYSSLGIVGSVVNYGAAAIAQPNASLAALPDDTFVSAWTDYDDDELGVRLQKLDPGAATQAPPLFANADQSFSQRSPDIIFDGSQIVVAWVDNSDPVNGPDLRYRTFSAELEPTSDDLTLAATSAVEDRVVLAAQGNHWAAAWRSGSGGLETIEVKSGDEHWSVGPFLPGPADDVPALSFVDATHLVLAFTAGSDDFVSGVANGSHLHGAILDTALEGQVDSFTIQPKVAPYSSLLGVSQLEPSIAGYADRLVVAWRSPAVAGSPEGDELWAREIHWTASGNTLLVDTSSPEQPLLTSGEARIGDQTRPVLLSSGNWPDHRLISAWQDNNNTFKTISGLPDVGVQFSRVPSELPPTPASGECVSATLGLSPASLALPPATVTLTATTNCGGGAVAEYKFAYQGPELGAQHVIRDWGPATATWSTTGLPSGKYVLTVYARRAGTTVAFDTYVGRDYFIGSVCNANPAISITPTGLQPQGTPFTLSASATCTGTTAEYRFAYTAPGSSTLVDIGTWSTTPVIWTTTAALASGTYTIYAYVRGIGNASAYETVAQGSANLGKICNSINSFVGTPASPAVVGTNVSLSATALCTGGATPEFRYYYVAPGTLPLVQIGNWSTGPITWNTTGLPTGLYHLVAQVRAAGNTSSLEASASTNYSLQPAVTCTGTLSAPTSPVAVGNTLPLSATAACGSGVTYRFAYAPAGTGSFTDIAAWGTSTSANWSASVIGNYDLAVFIRKSGTTTGYDASAQKTISVRGQCTSPELTFTPDSGHLYLSGYAACSDPQFSYFRATVGSSSWTAIGDPWVFGAVDMTTSSVPDGVYSFRLDAREGNFGAANSSITVNHRVGPGCTSIGDLGDWEGHPQPIGSTIDFGGMGYLCYSDITPEFSFYYRAAGDSEYVLFPGTNWQSSATATLDTSGFTVGGTYDVQVRLRAAGYPGTAELIGNGTLEMEDP